MRRPVLAGLVLLASAAVPLHAEVPVSLRGSPESMIRQNGVARALDLTFVRTPAEVGKLEREGALVRLEGNDDYEVADFVSNPQARVEMRTFIERLAAQYREATGEKLVVTSLTRPTSRQPGNSHALSIHPTGIAVDLRVSQRAASREWLERTLLALEGRGMLDITREYNPPHYHVALFPEPYMAHVATLIAEEESAREAEDRRVLAASLASNAFLAAPRASAGGEPGDSTTGLIAVLISLPIALLALARHRRRRDDSD
jgi:hypothetical protein